ncbi:MAG: hypothetical protein Q8904_07645 [Bacteroidota bacterium]|nr:hypothetical protein [Bacteroidota bacterium]
MKRRIKTILECIFVIACFCCGQLSCKNTRTEQYVGIDECSSTEIRLTLAPNQLFMLSKLLEDNKARGHEKQEIVRGNWVKEGKLLKLNTNDKNIIVYELTTENSVIAGHEFKVETYVFKTNLKDFFASKIDLNLDKTN